MKAANYEYRSILDQDTTIYEIIIQAGDNFAKIEKRNDSATNVIRKLNPKINPYNLKPRQKIKYQKALVQRVIVGWKPIDATFVLNGYNGGRDKAYAAKIDYALSKITEKEKVRQCFVD